MDYDERADYIWNAHAYDEVINWEEAIQPEQMFVWNEALGMAAQHVA